MTSAPKSASVCVQAGPATTRVKSTTSRPSSAVGSPFARGVRSGNCGLGGHFRHFPLVILPGETKVSRRDFKAFLPEPDG